VNQKLEKIQRGSYRFYKLPTGKELPSVTTVLSILPKPKIILWAVMQTIKFLIGRGNLGQDAVSEGYVFHKKLLDLLAQEGTDIHNLVEDYLDKGKDSTNDALVRFKEFEKQKCYKSDAVEVQVWDEAQDKQTAGTLDLVGSCFNMPIVLDIKTSKKIRLSHKIQSCIYRDMYETRTGKTGYSSGVLLIPRNSKTNWELYINSPQDELTYRKIFSLLTQLFQNLLQLKELELTK